MQGVHRTSRTFLAKFGGRRPAARIAIRSPRRTKLFLMLSSQALQMNSRRSAVLGTRGMVASSQPLASEVRPMLLFVSQYAL
jgi:hypothetical protein